MADQKLIDPPDAHPRTPKLKAPPGACDTHFHLFGPPDRYPQDPKSRYRSPAALPETYAALLATLGLSRAVLVNGGAYLDDTRHLRDTLPRYPDWRGIVRAAENLSDAGIAELDALGVRGVRVHGSGNLQRETVAKAKAFGWHAQFYPRDNLTEMAPALRALDTTFVLDHFAGIPAAKGVDDPSFKVLLGLLDTGRVWVKLSGPMRISAETFPHRDVTAMARALIRHAPERMVWGSDWPHTNIKAEVMPNDGDLIDLLLDWALDEADRTRILATNPAKLYGWV